MEDVFAQILLGHLAGDYLLQSKNMALKKSETGVAGCVWCVCHCAVYSLSVCFFLWNFAPWVFVLVFLTHFPMDRWSLASKWLNLIKGRDVLSAYESREKYREIDIAFSCLVYAIADNTMHLVLMYYAIKLI